MAGASPTTLETGSSPRRGPSTPREPIVYKHGVLEIASPTPHEVVGCAERAGQNYRNQPFVNKQTDPASQYELVGRVPLLAGLAIDDVRSLAQLATRRRFGRGNTIFSEGDIGDALYIVMSGSVFVTVSSAEGVETILAVLGPGECLGELSLLDGQPRSATASVAMDAETLVVSRQSFQRWLAEHPGASAALLRTLSMRIRRTNKSLADRSALDLPHRLAKQLLLLHEDMAVGTTGGSVPIRVTQQQLAEMLGATREAVNKSLREFVNVGWVEIGRGSITLHDREAIARFL